MSRSSHVAPGSATLPYRLLTLELLVGDDNTNIPIKKPMFFQGKNSFPCARNCISGIYLSTHSFFFSPSASEWAGTINGQNIQNVSIKGNFLQYG